MSDSGEGTASGDYDNETAGLEEKLRWGMRAKIEPDVRDATASDESDSSLDDWEADGGRRCGAQQ